MCTIVLRCVHVGLTIHIKDFMIKQQCESSTTLSVYQISARGKYGNLKCTISLFRAGYES
jgi:hypothetical protein